MLQPLRQRQILIHVALEHLQKFQVRVTRILNVVRQRLLYISDIACLKIHRARPSSRGEYRHSARAADEVLPFIRIRMPVQFAYTARMNGYNRRRNRC